MKFGVIIVTYNRLELLKECINCVLGQTVPFSRVCIVDNHSSDGTGAYLEGLTDAAENRPDSRLLTSAAWSRTWAEPAGLPME